jgi:tetratricopeptide (TPR) repeat protein
MHMAATPLKSVGRFLPTRPSQPRIAASRSHPAARRGGRLVIRSALLADFEEALREDANNQRAFWAWESLTEAADPVWAMCATGTAPGEKRLAACSQIIDGKDTSPVRRREALKHRASLYRMAMGSADNDRALADLNSALAISPRDAKALIARGSVWRAQGAFEAAIADFTSASQAAPKLGQPLVERGEAYEEQGDIDMARADYAAALKVEPHSVAQYKLQQLDAAAGKSEDPVLGATSAVGANGSENGAMAHDQTTRSLATCEGPSSLAPDARIAACDAALAKLTEEAARENFVLFLDRARAFAWRGWASYEKGNYDTALTDLDEAIRTDPNFKFMFFFRGRVHLAKKDYTRAAADLTHAAQNNFQPAFAQLAAAYFEQKDYPAAMNQLDEALRRDASDVEALFTREKVHMALGKSADALRDCKAALAIYPELKSKHACLAEAKPQPSAAPQMQTLAAPPVHTSAAPQIQPPVAPPIQSVAVPQEQTLTPPPASSSGAPQAQDIATPPSTKAAPPETRNATQPSIKTLPKDWITAR